MAYDASIDRVVLFGGADWSGHFSDTWEYDGAQWVETTGFQRPEGRQLHAMAYDAQRHQVVLFSGYYYDGATLTPFWDTWAYSYRP